MDLDIFELLIYLKPISIMIQVIRFRKPDVDKRKLAPLDPSSRHTNNNTSSKPGDQAQQHNNDRDGDIIHHFRIIVRFEQQHDIPNMGTL